MSTANTIELNIDDKAHSYARIYASLLSDEYQRKRAYASIAALYAFINLVEKTSNSIQKSMTLFRNPMINEQYEISDLYINNWHIDIRVVTGGDAVLVPKVHYDSNIVPDFYAVIKVDSSVQRAELIGFAPRDVQKEAFDYHYFSIPFTALISYSEFLEKIKEPKQTAFSEADHELFRTNYLGLMDNEIDIHTKNKILKHLFECSECRTEFCCFTGFEMVSCNASKYPELLDDRTLEIIGAQNVDDKKYEGKEETIYIGDENSAAQDFETENSVEQQSDSENLKTKDSIEQHLDAENSGTENLLQDTPKEETVSDILDELFNIDEGFIDSDTHEDKPVGIKPSDMTEYEDFDIRQIENINDYSDSMNSVHPKDDNNNDIKIIEDDETDSLLIHDETEENDGIQLLPNDNNDEINIIEESKPQKVSTDSDLVLIDRSEDNELITEISESHPDLETIDVNDEPDLKEENVQKVIVDYDEFGEPIYSYITEVPQDKENDTKSEIIPIDDENTAFEEYPNEKTDNTSEIETIEEDDIVDNINAENEEYSEKEFETYKETVNSIEEPTDLAGSAKDYETAQDYEETNGSDEGCENSTKYEDMEAAETSYSDKEEEVEVYNDDLNEEKNDTAEDIEGFELELDNDAEADNETANEAAEYKDEEQEYKNAEDDETGEEGYEEGEYDDYDIDEVLPEEQVKKSSSKIVLVVISLLAAIVLAGGGAFFFMKNAKHNNDNNIADMPNDNAIEIPNEQQTNDMFETPVEGDITVPENNDNNQDLQQGAELLENGMPAQGTIPVPELKESDLIVPSASQSHGDVNKAIANAFTNGHSSVSLRELNWFCTSELFSDRTFKEYLQNLDNTLKQNLKNNILNAVEAPPKDTVAAKFAVDNNGSLQKVIISESSGSEEIDNIVLQSINESFAGEKSQILNEGALKSDMYYLKVVIKL